MLKPRPILGPVIADLEHIGGGDVSIATAFYSAGALDSLNLDTKRLRFLVRLDLKSVSDWARGSLDPAALLRCARRHESQCDEVSLLISPHVHAKVYCGQNGYLVGSANLTVRGLCGNGTEILFLETESKRRKMMKSTLDAYAERFDVISIDNLDDYVNKNEKKVKKLKRKLRAEFVDETDSVPSSFGRPARLGDYSSFLKWLDKQGDEAAEEILRRAEGKGNLSGHIHQNFFGLRQLYIHDPNIMSEMSKMNPDKFKISGNLSLKTRLKDFVQKYAVDEGLFSLSTWRTYLPEYAGGKPKTGGGTIGNLNRMFPLVARYVKDCTSL